jgi:hypothetical protein
MKETFDFFNKIVFAGVSPSAIAEDDDDDDRSDDDEKLVAMLHEMDVNDDQSAVRVAPVPPTMEVADGDHTGEHHDIVSAAGLATAGPSRSSATPRGPRTPQVEPTEAEGDEEVTAAAGEEEPRTRGRSKRGVAKPSRGGNTAWSRKGKEKEI